jgi:hypothetical protein
MKNLKNIVRISVIALVISMSFTSCEQREDWRVVELENGGFIKFVQRPFSWEGSDTSGNGTITKYHIGEDPATSSFNALVEDPNGNVASVDFFVFGDFDGAPEDALPFASTTSFPFDVSFTTDDMASLFGVDASVFQRGDFFEFITVLTTNDGKVWISSQSACPECPLEPGDPNGPGTWNGGTIDGVILMGGDTGDNFLIPAVWYRVKYLPATD